MADSLVPSNNEPQTLPITHRTDPPGLVPVSLREDPEDDGSVDLHRAAAILRRNIWLIVISVVVGTSLGFAYSWWRVPVYEATASLRITENESPVPELNAIKVLGGGATEVNTELEVLRSRTLVERVIRELGLRISILSPRKEALSKYVVSPRVDDGAMIGRYTATRSSTGWTVTSPNGQSINNIRPGAQVLLSGVTFTAPTGDVGPSFEFLVSSREQALKATMRSLRVVRPSRDANVLRVTWRGHDPISVPAVPNSLVRAFIENRIATRKAGARSTVAFLNNQIDTLANELKSAEVDLRAYRESQGVVSFDEQAKVAVGKLAELQADRAATASELNSLEGTLRDIQTRANGPGSFSPWRQLLAFPTLLRIPSLGTLLETLNTLEKSRSDLLVRRTTKDPDVIALGDQIQSIENQVRSLVLTYMAGLRQQVAAADKTLATSNTELRRIPAQEVRLAELQRRTQILGDLFTLLQTKRKEAEIAQAAEDPSAQIVDYAERPDKPIAPLLGRNVIVSFLLGLMLGVMGAFARETLDTKLHTSDQLQETTGLAVLGFIPHFASVPSKQARRFLPRSLSRGNGTALSAQEQSGLREAFRALRVSIAFSSPVRSPKLLLMTSAFPSEGKSTAVANLARAMAEQKLRVLVVDADMRRGELHKTFLGNRAPGLSEILVGQADASNVTQSASFDGLPPVAFISTGTLPPNPAELLGGTRFLSFLKAIEPEYDAIIFDSPPVNNVSDSLLIAGSMDGVILVARGGQTQRSGLRFAQRQLLQVRARILGAILNDYDARFASYYGGYYDYTYGPTETQSG